MDFSLLPEEVDRSTIEQTILPAIQCLNQQLPGSNMVPRIIGFMVRASPDPNCRTAVFVNTNTWTVNTVENASELMEAVTTSLSSLSSSSPSPVLSSGGDDDIDDDDDDDGDDDEKLGPATKESIEAMPVVKVFEPGKECSVCLGEFDVGGKAKEMPCKHVYHSACIDKWLGICGSCPICRYSLPTEEKEDDDDDDDDDEDDDDDDDDDDDADVEGEETTEGVAGGDGDDEH